MSGNIHRIPNNAVASTPLGGTLRRFHTGEAKIIRYVSEWKSRSLIPRLRSIDSQWNKTLVNLVGGLYDSYSLYNIDDSRPFDAKKIFTNLSDLNLWHEYLDRPLLLEESLFSLFLEQSELKDSHSNLSTQILKIKNFSPPIDFLTLEDTPSTYTGQAGRYVGIDNSGTSIAFLFPYSSAPLPSLPDTLGAYPTIESLLVVESGFVQSKDLADARSWKVEQLSYSGLVDSFNFSGTASDNVLYSIDLGEMASNTSFRITLGTTFDGARVGFKNNFGENLNNNKFLHADTGAGVTLNGGFVPDRHQFEVPFAFTFVYSTANSSYYLTEHFGG